MDRCRSPSPPARRSSGSAGRTTVGLACSGLAVIYVAAVLGIGAMAAGPDLVSGLPGSIADQSAAWLAAVAVFRGTRHVDRVDDDLVVTGLLQWGLLLLVVPWILGTTGGEAVRSVFIGLAFPATLLFGAAGLLAIGLARLETLAALSGLDWRRNRAWLLLLAGVLLGMTAIAVPGAFLLGEPLGELANVAAGPLSILLTPFAEVARILIMVIFFLLGPIIDWLQSIRRPPQPQQPSPVGGSGVLPPDQTTQEPAGALIAVLVVLAAIAAVIVIALVLRASYRRAPLVDGGSDGVFEEREFRVPHLGFHAPRLPWLRSRRRPTTASGAYVAFLSELDRAPDLARRPDEAPAMHASRIREAGFEDPRAALLAADYQLERYALADLGPRETSRALRRFTRLREAIRRRPKTAPSGAARNEQTPGAASAPPPGTSSGPPPPEASSGQR